MSKYTAKFKAGDKVLYRDHGYDLTEGVVLGLVAEAKADEEVRDKEFYVFYKVSYPGWWRRSIWVRGGNQSKAAVLKVHPKAFALQAMGSDLWRIYRADVAYGDRLTSGCDTEAEAWLEAERNLAATSEPPIQRALSAPKGDSHK